MKPASSDSRGELYELMDRPYHINLITIKKGKARGGHKHKYYERFLLQSGYVQFIETGAVVRSVFPGEAINTRPNVAHAIYSPQVDSALVEVRAGGLKFKAEPDEILRAWVNWINETSLPKLPKCSECGRFHKTKDHVYATGGTGRNTTSWNKK